MASKSTIDYSGASWTGLFSSAPVTGDDVYVGTDNSQAITTNLDQTAVDLNSLTFMHPSRLRIGASGNPLKYELSGKMIWAQKAGSCFFEPTTTAAPDIAVAGPAFTLSGGTSTLVTLDEAGNLTVTDQHTLTAVNVYGGNGDIEVKSGDDFAVNTYAGRLVSRRNMTTVNVPGGMLETEDGDATATTLTVSTGGIVNWSGGAITTLNAYTGGVFDATMSRKPFTISTLNIARGATINLPKWVTVSTTNYLGIRATL